MSKLYRQSILNALTELSDRDLQARLWLSDGSGGSEVSSFVEAYCQLFDDSGLDDALQAGQTGLGIEADTALGELAEALRKVDDRDGPARTLEDPAMTEVRTIARRLLGLLTGERSEPST